MAYFIVIGTDNGVKSVVDEIKTAHLQHNVITSGCIIEKGEKLYYHWDTYNHQGKKENADNRDEPIVLRNALTNQISHFRTLLPSNSIPNVFIICQYLDDESFSRLEILCDSLNEIGGAQLSGLHIDIILLGYDLSKADDVTIRPGWRLLKRIEDITQNSRFVTNLLYINNMDFLGVATDVDTRILSKFMCNWSKIVCSASPNPKATVRSKVYAIGMSEHQYDFRDLNEFFHLSAEEKLLDRKLNHSPSIDTQGIMSNNYYKDIDLSLPWIDGLKEIQKSWLAYCETKIDTSISTSRTYSLARHEYELALYLNSFLKLYIQEENREIAILRRELESIDKTSSNTVDVSEIDDAIERIKSDIKKHEDNIINNSFVDLTDLKKVDKLINYLRSETALGIMRLAVKRATVIDPLPTSYPSEAVKNLGHSSAQTSPVLYDNTLNEQEKRPGCIGWIKGLFKSKAQRESEVIDTNNPDQVTEAVQEELNINLSKCVDKLREAEDVRNWWTNLCREISDCEKRKNECIISMDGETDINGQYLKGKEGYKPPYHRKSVSIINMDMVREFKKNDRYYEIMIDKFLSRWFDKSVPLDKRMTMRELSKHQVLDPLVGKFHTLKWDGSNPFVKEILTDSELHSYIEHGIKQSNPFVEYVRIGNTNISSTITTAFVSNNNNITADPVSFRNRYSLSDSAIVPIVLSDFVNSLCVVKVMDIPNHIDDLEDFKPKRETIIGKLRSNINIAAIVGNAEGVVEKARAIYYWMCDNIAYDTTNQIYDADSCWEMKRGLCRAYCELYCQLAGMVGLTADIIEGRIKNSDGSVRKHPIKHIL